MLSGLDCSDSAGAFESPLETAGGVVTVEPGARGVDCSLEGGEMISGGAGCTFVGVFSDTKPENGASAGRWGTRPEVSAGDRLVGTVLLL